MIRVTRKLLKILTKRQQSRIFIITIMMLVGGMMESLSVSLILPLVTAVIDTDTWNGKWYAQIICNIFHITNQRSYIEILLIILIVLFILKNIYLLFEIYIQNSFMASTNFKMRKGLMHAFLNRPYDYYLYASSGEIVRMIVTDTNQAFTLLSCAMGFYTEMIVSVIVGGTIIAMSWQIALGTIAILVVEMVVILYVVKPVMKRMGERMRKEGALSNKWMLQSINGIKSIKVSGTEHFFEEKYVYHESIVVDISRKTQTINAIPRLVIEAVTVSGILLILLFLVISGVDIISIVPQLSAFMVAAIRLLPSINRITGYLNGIPFGEGGLDNIIKLLEYEDLSVITGEKSDSKSEKIQSHTKITFKEALDFNDITFRYTSDMEPIFENANVIITSGQSVGIVGTSGAGKTTAVDIMLGLLKPDKGQILVDGTNIQHNMSDWLSHLAYIPQTIFLMDDTIRANVAFGKHRKDISDEQVWKAIKDAQLEEFVTSLPEGLDTTIGEAGVRLSGGQRQRIGIARALYNNPDILFFDEATSALDNETEAAIMDSIEHLKGKKTLVIIAHRLTTIENCDVVYKVQDGKIIQER